MAKATNPFMHYVADYEKEAEAFLTKYECADAIDNPRPIPIRDIATRLMSLDIIDTEYLSFDGSVQGPLLLQKALLRFMTGQPKKRLDMRCHILRFS